MSETPVPSWRPGFYDPGSVVRFAGRLWRCVQRSGGRPDPRRPNEWEEVRP